MMYVYVGILGMYLLLLLLSWQEEEKNIIRKMAAYVLRKQQDARQKCGGKGQNWKRDVSRRQLGEKLKTLQPGTAVPKQMKEYYLSQYGMVLIVVLMGDILCLIVWLGAHNNPLLIDGSYLHRNPYGGGEVPVGLAAQIEGAGEEVFDYLVEERKYTQEEIEVLYEEAVECLPAAILGENESLEDVRQDLELITGLEGYPFEIGWESSVYSLVNMDGKVDNEELEEGEIVMLTALFRCEEWSCEHQLYVQVNPVIYTAEETLRKRMDELIAQQQESTKNEDRMVLPVQIDEHPVVWREVIEDGSGYFLILVLIAAGVLYWGHRRELDQKLEQRRKELLLDYPEIVNKLALYMGAGMTIRNAFLKMGEDYKKQERRKKRYVYEEILIACYELQGGRSETEAYDHFGRRCQVQAYLKLSALLAQNLRKGSNDLLQMLRQEADSAFAQRKSLARKMGEEAGTKLLLPMMMMLCIVMVIIIIPAYFSFMM